jgi:2',3'-cyclic-nucleotide 2'-phosphodiesterase (5'-nucleotidase family)
VPKGGLARRVTWAKQELAAAQGPVVVVDAGSSLLGEYVALKSEGRVMVEAMNLAQYDAMAVGRMDVLLGFDVLQERAAEASFAILSANIVDTETQELLFEPYVIVERDGVSIGILGISDQEVLSMPATRSAAAFLDPIETAQRYVSELREQVDVVIVLSRLALADNEALAAEVPGINVIVGGKTRRLVQEPRRVDDALITEMSYNGERCGKLTVFVGADGAPYDYVQQVVALTQDWPDDPETAELLDEYRRRYPVLE